MKTQTTPCQNLAACFMKLKPAAGATTIFLLMLFVQYNPLAVYAQSSAGVAISEDSLVTPDPSAVLELRSKKGFLPPRMTTVERDSIISAATGLIVYDTDMNSVLYHDPDGWKDFGLWKRGSNHIYTNDLMAVGSRLAYDSTMIAPFTIYDSSNGLVSLVVADGEAYFPRNALNTIVTNAGNMELSLAISTSRDGSESVGSIAVAGYALLESNANQSAAFGAQVLYTGSGGDLGDFESVPLIAGYSVDNVVEDSTAEVLVIGGRFNSTSDHRGINLGIMAESASPGTFANIGIISNANVPDSILLIEAILDSFPGGLSASVLSYNYNAGANDFNLLAAGAAKSYFEGNVGIGTLSPTTELDVVGAVNADWYLQGGDTLALGSWSQTGNDLYYNNGNVGIGTETPVLPLMVVGGFAAAIHSTPTYPGGGILLDSARFTASMYAIPDQDTLFNSFFINQPDTVSNTGTIGVLSQYGDNESGFLITSGNGSSAAAITVTDSAQSVGTVTASGGYASIEAESTTESSALAAFPDHLQLASDSVQVTGKLDVSGAFFPPRMTATQASALTPVDGMMIYVTSTNGTFTTIGFWGYENGSWIDL